MKGPSQEFEVCQKSLTRTIYEVWLLSQRRMVGDGEPALSPRDLELTQTMRLDSD